MFSRLFNLPVFLISLFIGFIFIYLSDAESKTVFVYPTPFNLHKIEYKDTVGNCFDFSAHRLECPDDVSLIKTIPIQTNKKNNIE